MKRCLLIVLMIVGLTALLRGEKVIINGNNNGINLISSDDNSTILEAKIGSFLQTEIKIKGEIFSQISIEGEAETYLKGAPEVPTLTRSIIIDNSYESEFRIIDSEYSEYEITVAPSKGVISRDIDPATIPYTFGDEYKKDEFYPANITSLGSPYIMRNYRGVAVTFNPFLYNPKTKILRVYTTLRVEITKGNKIGTNPLTRSGKSVSSFESLYQNHFLNYATNRYASLDEFGSILVIAPSNYISTMQIYANWKIQKGIPTTIVNVATIGNNSTAIKNYIQNYYNSHPELAFVQIAGDAAQVASLSSGGGGADPMYSLVSGSDNYPDIFIGRFSAETTAQLLTQVERTLNYERDLNTSATYLNKALGIASAEGGSQGDNGETDIQHMNIIRNNLLNYNYTSVDQIYDPSASASAVAAALNSGRGQINYIGHGSNTTWSTTGFSNSYVNNLTNVGKLPFIVSVACVNGNFVSTTCFAEAWLRATYNGEPTGAMAIFASSINQSWASPMKGQDEINQLLTSETLSTIGGLFYSGSCAMIDSYSTDGVNMFKTWHIFGDASLQVRTNIPQTMNINHSGTLLAGSSTYTLTTGVANALVAMTYNNQLLGSGYTNAAGNIALNLINLPTAPAELTLTVTAFNKVTVVEPVTMSLANGPYLTLADYSVNDNNNNGLLEYGETGSLNLIIENIGTAVSSSGTISFSESDPYLTLNSASASFAAINAGSLRNINNVINLSLANNIPHNHTMTLSYIISAGGEQYTGNISLTGKSYVVEITNISINDTALGNGNSVIDIGETFNIIATIQNTGGAISPSNSAAIQNTNYITYANNTATIPAISAGSSQTISFTATASNSLPTGNLINFTINSNYPNGAIQYSHEFLAALLQIGDGNITNTHLPLEPYYGYTYSQSIYTASELNLGTSVINKIAYHYNGNSAWTDNIVLYMGNTTKNSFTSTSNWVTLPNLTQVYSGSFTVPASPGWIEIELTTPFIYYGASNLVIAFDENTYGYHASNDEFYCYNSGANRSIYYYGDSTNPNPASPVTAMGTSTSNPNLRIFASSFSSEPEIAVNADSIDLGRVVLGDPVFETLTISNQGGQVLSGTVGVNNDFTLQASRVLGSKHEFINSPNQVRSINFSINPRQSASYLISHSTAELGIFNGSLNITSNDLNNPTIEIPLSLAVIKPAIIAVNLHNINLSMEADQIASSTLSISNSGDLDLNCRLRLQAATDRESEIFSANFDNHDLSAWNINYHYSSNYTWHITDLFSGSSLDGSPFLFIDSNEAEYNDLDDTIESPLFNISNYESITIAFDHYFHFYEREKADVDFWTGSEWLNIGRWQGANAGYWSNPSHFSHTIINEGYTDVKIRFRYYNANWEWYWAIDNLFVSGEEIPAPLWVSMESQFNSFTLAPNSRKNIALNFSSAQLGYGEYTATLNVQSNSSTNSSLDIPITLMIGTFENISPNNVYVEIANSVTTINWDAIPSADYYRVFFSSDLATWTEIGQVNGTSFQHNQPRTEAYFYKIKAMRD